MFYRRVEEKQKLAGKNHGLALAGVIVSSVFMVTSFFFFLAIVLIAVPAIQANVRDTDRRTDLTLIETSIEQYVSNNQGALPTNKSELESSLNHQLFFFDNGIEDGIGHDLFKVYIIKVSDTVPSSSDMVAGLDVVHIFIGAQCTDNQPSAGDNYTDNAGVIDGSVSQGYAIVTTFEVTGSECIDNG